ncbi:MAG: hypothetical protein AAF490_25815 [Chloroflexota bacterium]
MNGLNELVFAVTQHADLLQQILANPSLIADYAKLSNDQMEAFLQIVNDQALLEHLQNVSAENTSKIFWTKPWG